MGNGTSKHSLSDQLCGRDYVAHQNSHNPLLPSSDGKPFTDPLTTILS